MKNQKVKVFNFKNSHVFMLVLLQIIIKLPLIRYFQKRKYEL